MTSASLPLFDRAQRYGARTAITTPTTSCSYAELLAGSAAIAGCLLDGREDLLEERVAFLVTPGADYVAVQWGIWRAGGIAVPLCLSHPGAELEYVVEDCGAAVVVADAAHLETARELAAVRGIRALSVRDAREGGTAELPRIEPSRRALILYTSGTTSRPKGVVTTHANIEAQVTALVEAWEWSEDDRILHFLPLHHIHGIINVLTCALWSGACCRMLPRFDAAGVWQELLTQPLTLFMAVPTIYHRLIAAWREAAPESQREMSAACRRLRLMVSGSAALPVSTLEAWREISGHVLLERYGMTEIGMGLSNPLRGERRPGHVGVPLPGVEVRLVDEAGAPVPPGTPGEIEVRGPAVFREYWNRPEATAAAFRDGWFRTGDVAALEGGSYRILGRSSVDIIKTGGYKVSALEIEEVLRTHPAIAECAVVGLEDPEWGERVGAALVLPPAATLTLAELREWCRPRLAPYKIPTRLLLLDELPRNAMGKVTKPAVVHAFPGS
ncbi:MAG: acyl-CoA synthetase [Armatimonadota bacterium]